MAIYPVFINCASTCCRYEERSFANVVIPAVRHSAPLGDLYNNRSIAACVYFVTSKWTVLTGDVPCFLEGQRVYGIVKRGKLETLITLEYQYY